MYVSDAWAAVPVLVDVPVQGVNRRGIGVALFVVGENPLQEAEELFEDPVDHLPRDAVIEKIDGHGIAQEIEVLGGGGL